uniref:Uncharacterized protein n=1 Tax=viral metagenome TaxID=1070528 RepID=A0A6M3L5W7_9ZZZZ
MSEKEIVVEHGSTHEPNKADTAKSEKGKPEKPGVERWWSTTDPGHMIAIVLDGAMGAVKFSEHAYECDLRTEHGKAISDQLHACGREGKDIFVLGNEYPENENGKRTELMRVLRMMANEVGGVNKIRGMFTHKELIKGGIHPASDDADALIMLALRTKSIKSRIDLSSKKESEE